MTGQSTVAGALLGAGLGLGVWLIVAGLIPATSSQSGRAPDRDVGAWVAARLHRLRTVQGARRLLIVAGSGVLVGMLTGWVVAAVLAAAAVWWLPSLLGPDRAQQQRIARIEAIATWTESLRDTLSAAAGLEQAIRACAPASPAAIRVQVLALVAAANRGERLAEALTEFARQVGDATCDLVVAALVMASRRQARNLGDLLGSLAAAARNQAVMRLRVEASRARMRTSVRVIAGTTLAMAVGLAIADRSYLAPYNTLAGQGMLLVIGAVFALGFWLLARMSRPAPEPRVFAPDAGKEVSAQ